MILAICLWSLYAFDLATPSLRDRVGQIKGTDFVHFYVLGTLANQGRGSLLYDIGAQAALIRERVPQAAALQYVPLYGPQVSIFFAPLAKLAYKDALICWWIFSAVLYAVSCYLLWRICPRLRRRRTTVVMLALAFPAFFALIAYGQSSAPALLAFVLAYLLLRAKHRFASGLAIGLLAFKPALAIGAAIVFLLAGEWLVITGAVLSAATQICIGWQYFGTAVMKDYLAALRAIPEKFGYLEPKVYMVHCLRAFWALLIPQPAIAGALYAASAIAVLAVAIVLWRSAASLELRYSGLLVTTVLVSPHLTVYDLVILAPVFLLLSEWHLDMQRVNADSFALLLYLCYALPLLGVVTRWTHLQISVLAFAGLLGWIFARARSGNQVVEAECRP